MSVIDDGFLNGQRHKWFRDTLRRLYTVKAVVSLPGDAFQRSEARSEDLVRGTRETS